MSKERDPRQRFIGTNRMSITKYSPAEREQAERIGKRYREKIRRENRQRAKIFATDRFQKKSHKRLK